MYFTKWKETVILCACICLLAVPALATTVTVSPATIPDAGSSVDVTIVADSLPTGLSGYIMTASVADPSVAEITAVTFPSWASMKLNSAVPASEVSLRASDLSLGVSPGATGVTLVTLTVKGKIAGATTLGLTVRQMDPDGAGDPINPTVIPGTISVGGVVPTATVTPTATPTATPTQPGQEPGYITVFSYPLGGSVALDGTVIGTTPLQDYAVEPGTHTLTAAYPGYREYTTTVTVSPGEHKRVPLIIFMKGIPTMFPTTIPTTSVTTNIPTAVPTATLTPTATVTGSTGTGALKISTVPRGATIYIDDVVKGISPATISDIPAGNHELKVAKQNYKTTVKTVTVQAGKTIQVPLIVLSPTRSGF